MKILQISNDYLANELYFNLFTNFDKSGITSTIFAPLKKGAQRSQEIITKTNSEYLYAPECFSNFERVFFYKKENKIIEHAMDKYKNEIDCIDLVHAHTLFSNGYIASIFKKRFHKPYVITVRNTDINVFFKYRVNLRSLGIRIMEEAESIIFLSPIVREHVIEKYVPKPKKDLIVKKSLSIPNGINEFWLDNRAVKGKHLDRDELNILYVGEINHNKNISFTIKACRELISKGFRVRFTVVGKCINNYYRKLLNQKFIFFNEFCPKEKLISYYKEADIFVMPSRKETFGLVYAEALSQGLPIIYTKGQGFDGQFKEGEVGYSVQCNDAKDIRKKIELIIEHYEYLSSNAIVAASHFDWSNIAQKYINLYKKFITE